MAYDSQMHRVVLFGGWGTTNYLSDTWVLSGNTWSQLTTSSGTPAARESHAMVYDSQQNRILLFGG